MNRESVITQINQYEGVHHISHTRKCKGAEKSRRVVRYALNDHTVEVAERTFKVTDDDNGAVIANFNLNHTFPDDVTEVLDLIAGIEYADSASVKAKRSDAIAADTDGTPAPPPPPPPA